jgi:hypothetical protein
MVYLTKALNFSVARYAEKGHSLPNNTRLIQRAIHAHLISPLNPENTEEEIMERIRLNLSNQSRKSSEGPSNCYCDDETTPLANGGTSSGSQCSG